MVTGELSWTIALRKRARLVKYESNIQTGNYESEMWVSSQRSGSSDLASVTIKIIIIIIMNCILYRAFPKDAKALDIVCVCVCGGGGGGREHETSSHYQSYNIVHGAPLSLMDERNHYKTVC